VPEQSYYSLATGPLVLTGPAFEDDAGRLVLPQHADTLRPLAYAWNIARTNCSIVNGYHVQFVPVHLGKKAKLRVCVRVLCYIRSASSMFLMQSQSPMHGFRALAGHNKPNQTFTWGGGKGFLQAHRNAPRGVRASPGACLQSDDSRDKMVSLCQHFQHDLLT
jgi:hypothetical protein